MLTINFYMETRGIG